MTNMVNVAQKYTETPQKVLKSGTKTPAKIDAAKTLKDLFEDSLKDIYWAEKALLKAIPKMVKNATSEHLKKALNDHFDQTHNHVNRLQEAFASMGKRAVGKKCDAMAGLIEEGEGIIEETEPGPVRDAGIIAACQKVEHYEIATYGTLAAFAKVLKEQKALLLLLETLAEEKMADELLTSIADTDLNTLAMN
jgi:ferritin-like metal-binding protein YciE